MSNSENFSPKDTDHTISPGVESSLGQNLANNQSAPTANSPMPNNPEQPPDNINNSHLVDSKNNQPSVDVSQQPIISATSVEKNQKRQKLRKRMLIIFVAILLAVVLIVAGMALKDRNSEDSGSVSSETNELTEKVDSNKAPLSEEANNNDNSGLSQTQNKSSDGPKNNNNSSSPSATKSKHCGVENMPQGVCTAIKSIESEGIYNNQYIATDTSVVPPEATINIKRDTWKSSNPDQGTISYTANYSDQDFYGLLYFNKQNNSWEVVDYTLNY